MPETRDVDGNFDPAQVAELALLVDLEARWENLRTTSSRPPDVQPNPQGLSGKQKAYENFRGKLAAYNKRYLPAHVPELLLNNPVRLGKWCRSMADLYLRVENDPRTHCPVHLIEKAFRWADKVAVRLHKECVGRSPAPTTIRAAIQELEALAQWCVGLAGVASAA